MDHNHEDAVKIAFYYDWRYEEGDSYEVVALCDMCAEERGGNVGMAGDPGSGWGWCCEDCGSPNEAALGLQEEEEN